MVRRSPLSAEAKLMLSEIEQRRRIKARSRIAKLLAKKRGALDKMPATGKAALRAIRAGKW